MALIFCLLLPLFWGQGHLFELQEAIQELQIENTELQGKIQNLTEALSELQVFVWNQSQGEAPYISILPQPSTPSSPPEFPEPSPHFSSRHICLGLSYCGQVSSPPDNRGSESAVEHLHHEHLQCHPNAHWRNTAAATVLAPSVIWLLALMFWTVTLTKD